MKGSWWWHFERSGGRRTAHNPASCSKVQIVMKVTPIEITLGIGVVRDLDTRVAIEVVLEFRHTGSGNRVHWQLLVPVTVVLCMSQRRRHTAGRMQSLMTRFHCFGCARAARQGQRGGSAMGTIPSAHDNKHRSLGGRYKASHSIGVECRHAVDMGVTMNQPG